MVYSVNHTPVKLTKSDLLLTLGHQARLPSQTNASASEPAGTEFDKEAVFSVGRPEEMATSAVSQAGWQVYRYRQRVENLEAGGNWIGYFTLTVNQLRDMPASKEARLSSF